MGGKRMPFRTCRFVNRQNNDTGLDCEEALSWAAQTGVRFEGSTGRSSIGRLVLAPPCLSGTR